jgi:drug/metabolite transporter (DMT)-like permease
MKKISAEHWFVVTAGILSGLVVFGGKVLADFGLSIYEISILPFLFATIILSFFVIFKKECRFDFKKGIFWLLLLYGIVGLFVTVAQFSAVVFGVSVALTVLLLYTQPLWTMIFSYFILKEKIVAKEVIACIIVLLGVLILINPFQENINYNWIGILLALIGGFSLSGWVVVGSLLSKKGNNPINSLFTGNFLLIIFLLCFYPFARALMPDNSISRLSFDFTPAVWFYILAFGVLVGVANQLFYLNGVKKVPTVDAGIIMLLEPISGSVLAGIFLEQALTLHIFIGGFFILFANYLVLTKNK